MDKDDKNPDFITTQSVHSGDERFDPIEVYGGCSRLNGHLGNGCYWNRANKEHDDRGLFVDVTS